MKNQKNIRVLQHDLEGDNIRIGAKHSILDGTKESLDAVEKDVVGGYETICAWCGGFEAACKKYYKHVAIVDADTLEVVRLIYPKNENN